MMTSTRRIVLAALPWIVLVHVALFLLFWLTNSLFYSEVNDYLTNLLHTRQDYISICLLISAAVGVWSIARWVVGRSGRRHPVQGITSWLFVLVAVIYLVFFYGSFWYLFRQSPIQVPRIGQMVLYFRALLDPMVLIVVTALAALWLAKRVAAQRPVGWTASLSVVALPIAVCALLWVVPLIYPPDSVYSGALPAKPKIIAHRGASMLAPENTLVAMERAAELGTYGVETDLSLSRDGVPFLMHDTSLNRTTNVASLFPGREKNGGQDFTFAEIRQLNAGEWFIRTDPYHTIASGAVPAVALAQYRQQRVPTLAEMLDVVRKNRQVFIFDLKKLTTVTSSGQTFFDIVLRQIHEAGIDPQVWFLVDGDELKELKAVAPQMHPAYGGEYEQPRAAADLKAQGYEIVNDEYGLAKEWIKKYQAAGLWVNLYTIDEPWQYSRLWLIGVNSVTSSNSHTLIAMEQPQLSMSYSTYVIVWGVVGLACLGILGGVAFKSMRGQD